MLQMPFVGALLQSKFVVLFAVLSYSAQGTRCPLRIHKHNNLLPLNDQLTQVPPIRNSEKILDSTLHIPAQHKGCLRCYDFARR
jgi:hypothetical protein